MKNRRAFLHAAGAAAVMLFGTALPTLAQFPGGGQGRPGGGFGGPGGMMNNPQMAEMLFKMRQSRVSVDPGISNTANLLTRPDVLNALVLNGRQTEQLASLNSAYPQQMGQHMQQSMMQGFQKMQAESGGNFDFRNASQEERQQFMQQVQGMAQDALITFQSDQDKKAEAILRPDQAKRLHELDLQWRGPLALADPDVNAKFNLTDEQKTKLKALLKEYRDAHQQTQMGMFGGGMGRMGRGPNGNAPGAPAAGGAANDTAAPKAGGAPPTAAGGAAQPGAQGGPGGRRGFGMPTPEEMQKNMADAVKQTDALLKPLNTKALALLSPEQQQQWKIVQGKPFAFRQNP